MCKYYAHRVGKRVATCFRFVSPRDYWSRQNLFGRRLGAGSFVVAVVSSRVTSVHDHNHDHNHDPFHGESNTESGCRSKFSVSVSCLDETVFLGFSNDFWGAGVLIPSGRRADVVCAKNC